MLFINKNYINYHRLYKVYAILSFGLQINNKLSDIGKSIYRYIRLFTLKTDNNYHSNTKLSKARMS